MEWTVSSLRRRLKSQIGYLVHRWARRCIDIPATLWFPLYIGMPCHLPLRATSSIALARISIAIATGAGG
jgi:hypothetical protein